MIPRCEPANSRTREPANLTIGPDQRIPGTDGSEKRIADPWA